MADISIHYEFHSFRFVSIEGVGMARASGYIEVLEQRIQFGIAVAPNDDGSWALYDARIRPDLPAVWTKEVLQHLLNHAATLLETINMWPSKQTCSGAQISANKIVAPPDVSDRVVVSFRSNLLSLPVAKWEQMWEWIEARMKYDKYFSIQGVSENEISQAVPHLRNWFTAEWVAARYREASGETSPSWGANYEPDQRGWYPACHLARTALGAICIDPAWNYLIELGLSIEQLSDLDGLEKLKAELLRSSGTQHHLCLAADLRQRGLPIAIEPRTGSGSAKSDLRVTVGEHSYDIEAKEFSSNSPAKRLRRELAKKARNLPQSPQNPIVFHVVLIDVGQQQDPRKEQQFFEEVRSLSEEIPPTVSAIVAGRRFVDASGGRVKRDAQVFLLNPRAVQVSQRKHLEEIFRQNYNELLYPVFGIGSLFHFG